MTVRLLLLSTFLPHIMQVLVIASEYPQLVQTRTVETVSCFLLENCEKLTTQAVRNVVYGPSANDWQQRPITQGRQATQPVSQAACLLGYQKLTVGVFLGKHSGASL